MGDEEERIGVSLPNTLLSPNRSSGRDYSADVKNCSENNIGGLQSIKSMIAAEQKPASIVSRKLLQAWRPRAESNRRPTV